MVCALAGGASKEEVQHTGLNVVKNEGWEMVKFQMHGTVRKYKPGYVASTPGSILHVEVSVGGLRMLAVCVHKKGLQVAGGQNWACHVVHRVLGPCQC